MDFIAGDIGGTKSWLAWVKRTSQGLQLGHEQCYASADYASADALLRRFMADAAMNAAPESMLLALPGPLHEQRASLTNLAWTLDAVELARSLDIASVRLINDFQAAAAGVATLTDSDVIVLNSASQEKHGVRAITGAGTGLGLAFMVTDAAGRYQNFATEGGHIDFAPVNATQTRLLEYLRHTHVHVSWERVVSGLAMNDLYRFCCLELNQPLPDEPVDGATLTALAGSGDVAAEAALDLFIDLYGAWVGNVALMYRPQGGLYIAGGVAGHMLERMQQSRFMTAASAKGRLGSVVERTPIFLIATNRLGIQGAIASVVPEHPSSLHYINSDQAVLRSVA